MRNILIGLVVVIAAAIAFVATRPSHFHIERSTTVAAADSIVFVQVNDFDGWAAWSPWEHLDPNMKKEITGPEQGEGAIYYWSGTDEVGEGRMTITESLPVERIGIKLEFLKPFEATNTTVFSFVPDGEGTRVTWSMEGNNNFVAKAMSVFMNMDKMVGGDFEKGLASLKQVSEAHAAAAAPTL